MTEQLFRDDAYLQTCEARIVRIDDNGIVLDRTVFYSRAVVVTKIEKKSANSRRVVPGWAA